jgi:hypothetical protein
MEDLMLTHKSLFFLLFVAALTGCDLASKAIVVVNTPGAVSTPATTSTQPTSAPQSSAPSIPAPTPSLSGATNTNTVINIPSPTTSLPVLPIPAPSASVSVSADVSIFRTKIPKPSAVKGYLRTEITQATELFKQRYEANKTNAFEVLKMWIDAELLGTANPDLAKSLLEIMLAQNGSEASHSKTLFEFSYLPGKQPTPENEVALLYRNVSYVESLKRLSYEDFDNRTLQMVKQLFNSDTGKTELIPVTNPADALPLNSKDGDVINIDIKPNDSTTYAKANIAVSFKLILDDGWKIIYSSYPKVF